MYLKIRIRYFIKFKSFLLENKLMNIIYFILDGQKTYIINF